MQRYVRHEDIAYYISKPAKRRILGWLLRSKSKCTAANQS